MPFFRGRPGGLLTATTLSVVALGVILTVVPLRHTLGFTVLPWQFFAALLLFVVTYLLLVEATKKVFYREPIHVSGLPHRTRGRAHRIQRRAARLSLVSRIPRPAIRRRTTA